MTPINDTPIQGDASRNGLPAQPPTPTQPSTLPSTMPSTMHEKAVADGPTTINGVLSAAPALHDTGVLHAEFATHAAAQAAADALIAAGIPRSAIHIAADASQDHAAIAQASPADDTLIGRIRDTIMPDEVTVAARTAIATNTAILEVRPGADHVDTAARILQASNPTRFDADLERWRAKS